MPSLLRLNKNALKVFSNHKIREARMKRWEALTTHFGRIDLFCWLERAHCEEKKESKEVACCSWIYKATVYPVKYVK